MSSKPHQSPLKQESSPHTPHQELKASYRQMRNSNFDSGEKFRSLELPQAKPFHSRITDNHNTMQRQNPEDDTDFIALVPCRWQAGGWKYVTRDPAKDSFFSNPNRMNSTGFNFRQAANSSMHMPDINKNKHSNMDQFRTTYQEGFSPQRQQKYLNDVQKYWTKKDKLNKTQKVIPPQHQLIALPNNKEKGIYQWGGGFHQRQTFNKKKDQLKDWIEVYFRN